MAEARSERTFLVRSRTAAWALERAYVAAPLILRLTLGPVILVHGIQKLTGLGATAAGFGGLGIPVPMLAATVVMLVEVLGGAGLILGLFTRAAAFFNFFVQLTATLVVHVPRGFWAMEGGWEFTFVNMGVLLALLVLGAGALSLDHLIRDRTGKLEARRSAPTKPARVKL